MYTLKQPTNAKLAVAIERYRATQKSQSKGNFVTGQWQNHMVRVIEPKPPEGPMTLLDYVLITTVTIILCWVVMYKERKHLESLYALCPEPDGNVCHFTIMSIVPIMATLAGGALFVYERHEIARKNRQNTIE